MEGSGRIAAVDLVTERVDVQDIQAEAAPAGAAVTAMARSVSLNSDITVRAGRDSTCWPTISAKLSASDTKPPGK
jgi:hypothetical protein